MTDYFSAIYWLRLNTERQIKSKRYDVFKVYGKYEPLEKMMQGKDGLFCYLRTLPYDRLTNWKESPCMEISHSKRISCIYSEASHPYFGWGDMIGTHDALLFEFNDSWEDMRIILSVGRKANIAQLVQEWLTYKCEDEFAEKLKQSKPIEEVYHVNH